ncbi:MAG TPA: hypothetical protein PKA61_10320, partial [Nitrospira sp.]|nr:hypothetical protein [Nitrospira sp.]
LTGGGTDGASVRTARIVASAGPFDFPVGVPPCLFADLAGGDAVAAQLADPITTDTTTSSTSVLSPGCGPYRGMDTFQEVLGLPLRSRGAG